MARTSLLLATICCIQVVMKVCSLPVHSKTKTTSLKFENLFRSGLRRQRRSSTPSYPIFLYSRNAKGFVKVTRQKIIAHGRDKTDKYAELIITKLGFQGQISIMGKKSKLYICMNRTGKVHLKKKYTQPGCMFYNTINKSGYVTLRSAANPVWYLGFKQRGTIRHGHRTRQHHRAAWMMQSQPNFG